MRGYAPLGRMLGLAMIIAGLGTVTLATPEAAVAATADRPTAIGVASDGTTYVGFAGGGKLQRLSAKGGNRGSIALRSDEAVDGVFVTGDNQIWVDFETEFALYSRTGRLIAHHDHQPQRSCGSNAPAHRFGGITSAAGRVFVANRCHPSVSVYSRRGELEATVNLPGKDFPRGIAYGNPQNGRGAMLYVAVPGRGQVLAYKASSLRRSSKPADVFTLHRPRGGKKPQPSGIAVDKYGQLTVTDAANNAVYLADTNNHFSVYRALGHGPRAGREAGRLNGPTALAQHAQDGSGLSGNLFIADTDNHRVQRWDTGGYTYWSKGVRAGAGGRGGDGGGHGGGNGNGNGNGGGNGGSDGNGPKNLTKPSITGTAAVGGLLTCDKGTWSGSDSPFGGNSYYFQWLRNGTAISGATSNNYTAVAADNGAKVACSVRASNADGSTTATSAAVTIGDGGGNPGGSTPANTVAPSISGTAAVGQALTCNPGTWTPSGVSFGYQWRRAGVAIGSATAATYTVTAADSGAALTCVVRGTLGTASTEASSPAVVVGGGGTGTNGPVNTVPPAIVGSAAVGQNLFCTSGTWTGATSYTYEWRRSGAAIAGATGSTYTVTAADTGTTLACVVRAANATGTSEVSSAAVTVGGTGGPVNTVAPTILGTPAVGQLLNCSSGIWSGTGIGYTYQWLRAGVAIGGATSSTYRVAATDSGTAISCIVRAQNGSGTVEVASAPVTIGGSGGSTGPVNTVAPSISGTAAVGQVLTCNPGSWSGTVTGYAFQWLRAGAQIGAATSSTYVVTSADNGTALACAVRASNGAVSTDAVSAALTVGGGGGVTVPVNVSAPAITGTPAVGQVLTCNPGGWSGTVTGYAFQWYRAGAPIAAATASTYVVSAADSGAALSCVVRATNQSGSTDAVSASVTVGGGGSGSTAPVNVTPPTISGTGSVGQVLTCNPGTWSWTGVGITYAFQWYRGGSPVGTATSATYVLTAADSGATLTCAVRASNQSGSTDAVSASITIGGGGNGGSTAPVNLTPPTVSGTAAVGQVLTCNPGTWSFTGVGVTYSYQWQRAGAPIGTATTATYTVPGTDAGVALSCLVRASNSAGSTDAVSSAVLVGGGGGATVPVNLTPPTITGTPSVGGVLTCSPGTWSWGGVGVSYGYKWLRSGAQIGAATGSAYTVTAADAGASLSCVVRASNSAGNTDASSASVAIGGGGSGGGDGAPVNLTSPVISGLVSVGQLLTCNPGTWSWSGVGVNYDYQWRRGGSPIASATSSGYSVSGADVGTALSCAVRASNAYGATTAVSSPVLVGGG